MKTRSHVVHSGIHLPNVRSRMTRDPGCNRRIISPYLNFSPHLPTHNHVDHPDLPRKSSYVLLYILKRFTKSRSFLTQTLTYHTPVTMASTRDIDSGELPSQTSLRMAKFWLQFALNQIDIGTRAISRFQLKSLLKPQRQLLFPSPLLPITPKAQARPYS